MQILSLIPTLQFVPFLFSLTSPGLQHTCTRSGTYSSQQQFLTTFILTTFIFDLLGELLFCKASEGMHKEEHQTHSASKNIREWFPNCGSDSPVGQDLIFGGLRYRQGRCASSFFLGGALLPNRHYSHRVLSSW